MYRNCLRLVLILLVSGMMLPGIAGDLRCSGCGRTITGNYLKTAKGKVYCNRNCFNKSLPKCTVCGKRITGRYFPHKGKNYCSRKCLSTVMPECELCLRKVTSGKRINGHFYCNKCAAKPRCFECGQPFAKGLKLQDDRLVCTNCQREAVLKEEEMEKLFHQARDELKKITGEKTRDAPEFQLSDLKQMIKVTGLKYKSINPRLRGYYHRTERHFVVKGVEDSRRVEINKTIYLLYGMTRANAMCTAIHENTHDLMAEHYPEVQDAPMWVQEGVAQYTASIYARRNKLARQTLGFEKHPDPVYGNGYRFFQKKFGNDNWPAAAKWLKATDVTKLPQDCPVK